MLKNQYWNRFQKACFEKETGFFLTDFGGHQNAQLNDAIDTLTSSIQSTSFHVKKIAILDGVCYIKSGSKMYKEITSFSDDTVVLSATLLREFLGSL